MLFNQYFFFYFSGRILYDIPCKVCRDHSSGKHYGIYACDGCAGFFKRSVRRHRQYVCKAPKTNGLCVIDKTHRNQCRACRLKKCLNVGMNKDAVQHERGPRNSTLKKQMQLFMNNDTMLSEMTQLRHEYSIQQPILPIRHPPIYHPSAALDLSIPRVPVSSPYSTHPTYIPPFFPQHLQEISSRYIAKSLSELSAELVLNNIQWIKTLSSFGDLPLADRITLGEESWRELFILGVAQTFPAFHLAHLFNRDEKRSITFLKEADFFKDILEKLRLYHLDSTEYACLREIVLYKPHVENDSSINTSIGSSCSSPSSSINETKPLENSTLVREFFDKAKATLANYIAIIHPSQPHRYRNLLLILPQLRFISVNTIQELFCLVGVVPNGSINKLATHIYLNNN